MGSLTWDAEAGGLRIPDKADYRERTCPCKEEKGNMQINSWWNQSCFGLCHECQSYFLLMTLLSFSAPSFPPLTSISQNALDFFSSHAHTAHYIGKSKAAYTLFLCLALYVLWILSVKPPGSFQHKAANGSPGSVSWGRTFLQQPEN